MSDYLSFLMDPLRDVLYFIHNNLGVTWAVSIILLTIMVRLLLIPLTVKQYTSMRAMQRLQPKIKELQKKYKDDRQKLNEELMKFYRDNKVNPFGSCLPLLLQMPVFMALYFMLTGESFEPDNSFFWINNITQPDKALVFIYVGSQLLSSKMLTTTVDRTQQMMMYMMPLFFGVFFLIYPFPAGVLLYWVTTNIWTIGQQLVVMRIIKAREGEPEPVTVTAAPSGAAARKTGEKRAGKTGPKKKRRR